MEGVWVKNSLSWLIVGKNKKKPNKELGIKVKAYIGRRKQMKRKRIIMLKGQKESLDQHPYQIFDLILNLKWSLCTIQHLLCIEATFFFTKKTYKTYTYWKGRV